MKLTDRKRISDQSRPRLRAGSFEKETWVASAMIIVSNPDRALTVREWDPSLQLQKPGM